MCSAIATVDELVDYKANASDDAAEASSILTKLMDGYKMKKKKKDLVGENLDRQMKMGSQKPRARKRFQN